MNGVKLVGIIILTVVLIHYLGLPWGLVAGAGEACVVLP